MLANKAKFVDFVTTILIFFYKIRHFPELLHPFLFLASVCLLCLSDIRSTLSACNFQSMKSPVKLNSLFLKFFSYITWFDYTRHWTPCKWGLYIKSYCFFEAIAYRFENYKLLSRAIVIWGLRQVFKVRESQTKEMSHRKLMYLRLIFLCVDDYKCQFLPTHPNQ